MVVDKQFIMDIFNAPLSSALGALVMLYLGYKFGTFTQSKEHAHQSSLAGEAREDERQKRIRDGYADVCARGAAILNINTEIRLGAWQDPTRLEPLRNKAKIALGELRTAVSVLNVLDSDKERCSHADAMFDHANSLVVLISCVANPQIDGVQGRIHEVSLNGIQTQIDEIGKLFP